MNRLALLMGCVIASLALALTAFIPAVQSEGVVGIENVSPSFDTIIIDTTERARFAVDLTLTDMNGHDRIQLVIVTIYGAGDILANFTFNQYNVFENGTIDFKNIENKFDDRYGNYLVAGECLSMAVDTSWVNRSVMQNLRVLFKFLPLEADTIKIICVDTGGKSAIYTGPFPGNPGFLFDEPIIPLAISLVVALAGAGGIVLLRFNSNKLAKLVEKAIARR